MKVRVGHFTTRLGTRERRLYVDQMLVDGVVVLGVTVFPHPCGTCAGGDHVHVDTHQVPDYLEEGEVALLPEAVEAIEAVLRAAAQLNAWTHRLQQCVAV